MAYNTEKIISSYHNEPKIEYVSKFLLYDTQCDFIMTSWNVGNGFWYIATIYDNTIDDKINDNDGKGWYLHEEPTVNNIPIRHSKLYSYDTILTKSTKIICGFCRTSTPPLFSNSIKPNNKLPADYTFAIKVYIEKLYLLDCLNRQKYKQEIMLSNISHSIRTPLNGILHITDNMIKNKNDSDKTISNKEKHLEYLNQSAVALATNIFDIIDITKLELGKIKIEKSVFNLRDMLSSVMNIAHNLNKTKNIALDIYIENSVPEYIFSDSKRIKQILINLLENSLQYCNSGEVLLHVSSNIINLIDEDKNRENSIIENSNGFYNTDVQYDINFSVKDTGPGMDVNTKSQLFYPMEFMKNSKQQGISLRISYMLAKILGGELRLVYSEPNKGTCIDLNLIACEEEPPVYLSNTIKSLKGKSVLLADTTNDRINICKVLERYSMNYIIASSYEEITVLHGEKKFDLIIVKSEDVQTIKCIRDLFPLIKILYCGNLLSKHYDYLIDNNSDDHNIKIKLLEIFNDKQSEKFKPKNILVVEDEQINRIVIEKILNQLGYNNVGIAVNGDDALKMYSNNIDFYDLLLIDIRMPGISGFELADKVYELCCKNNIKPPKMIGITAQLIIDENLKPWFNTFLYKPIDVKELEEKITN